MTKGRQKSEAVCVSRLCVAYRNVLCVWLAPFHIRRHLAAVHHEESDGGIQTHTLKIVFRQKWRPIITHEAITAVLGRPAPGWCGEVVVVVVVEVGGTGGGSPLKNRDEAEREVEREREGERKGLQRAAMAAASQRMSAGEERCCRKTLIHLVCPDGYMSACLGPAALRRDG